MENLFMGFGVSGMMLAVVFLIVWVIQSIMKKDKTVSITGLKFSVILFLAGLFLSVGIGFTVTFALLVGVIYFVFKRNKKTQDSSEKPKRTFWNIPFRSEPKAVAIAAAISLCITVWATVDFYRTADTITVDSPSAEVNIEDKQKAEEEAEQKAAEEAAAKKAEPDEPELKPKENIDSSKCWTLLLVAIIIGALAYYIHRKNVNKNDQNTSDKEEFLSERISFSSSSPQNSATSSEKPQLTDFWDPDKLYTPRVRERLKRAKSEDITIGRRLFGSTYQINSYDETYKTSLESCTCPDFSYKQTPCKHMLKLALEIGALDPNDQLFGIPEEVDQRYQSLSKTAKKALLNLCHSHLYKPSEQFIVKRSVDLDALLKNGFVIESVDPEFILKNVYTVSELRAILREYQNETGIKVCTSNDSKQTIINNILQQEDRCISLFTSHYIILEFDPEIAPHIVSLYDKYSN